MKLTQGKCQIVGLRVGELTINLLNPIQPKVSVKFVLLREDGTHAGLYTKSAGWGDESVKAFESFIGKLEEEALTEIFEHKGSDQPQELVEGDVVPIQDRPTLGDGKGVPQV